MFPSVLIVDDEPSILRSLSGLLSDEGFEVETATNGYEALKIIDTESPDLVLLDIWMPGIDGIETLKEIKKNNPFIQVIIITGHGTIETAVKATKLGAFDLIEKPLSIDKVIVAINNALNFRRLEEENRYLRKKTIEKHSITGNSPLIKTLKKQISIIAPTNSWALITGENGTGKELVARTIHLFSPRVDQPFVDINCAAMSEKSIENELFGHEKGAFSGAGNKKRGFFELAGNGSIFLDEIGDMNLQTQAKMLRALQQRQFQRIGGARTLKINARIIAASNKDLEVEIEKGRFREDLYYRLNVVPVEVPPLRDRLQDIPLLVETFIKEFTKQNQSKGKIMTKQALDLLSAYSWPGNIRELKNLVERLIIVVYGSVIDTSDIPAPYNLGVLRKTEMTETQCFLIDNLKDAQEAFKTAFIQKQLMRHKDNIDETAKAVGVEENYLRNLLKKRRQ